jgi:hypothetical protein
MNAMRRPGAAMSPRPKMEYGFAAFALNCGKISFIGPSKAEEVATVTITLSPNTCDDPKTQKTSYRSSPHSIAAAVAKLPRESSCRSSVTIHTAMKLLRVKGAPDCLLATAAPTPTTHTAKTNIT